MQLSGTHRDKYLFVLVSSERLPFFLLHAGYGVQYDVQLFYLVFLLYGAGNGTQSLVSARQELYHRVHLQASFNLDNKPCFGNEGTGG